jgi:3-dehydroquinate synthetase
VVADPAVLSTRPARETRCGMAEMIKHGAISDPALFHDVVAWCADLSRRIDAGSMAWDDPAIARRLARSIAVKADVVREDPLEAGRRHVLNAGHTIAHAVERASNWSVPHGEAVAMGLVAEARLAERIGVATSGTAEALEAALAGAGLPTEVPAMLEVDDLLGAMRADKKSRDGRLSFALLAAPGRCAGDHALGWTTRVADADVVAVLEDRAARRPDAAMT